MFFLISTIVIIRRQFGWRQGRATDGEAKIDLAKTELTIITKLAVIMGNTINNLCKIIPKSFYNRGLLDRRVY